MYTRNPGQSIDFWNTGNFIDHINFSQQYHAALINTGCPKKNVHAKPGNLRTRLFSDYDRVSSQKLISLYFIKICQADQEL